MRLAVVSDTHGHLLNTRDAVERLSDLNVDAVLHCGDIGSPHIVPLFAPWPTHFVFGNVDEDREGLEFLIQSAGQTCHGRFGALPLQGLRIAFLHGDDAAALNRAVASGEYDLVCHGHTHQTRLERRGRTLILNPGALFRATPHTFATVDLPGLVVDFHDIHSAGRHRITPPQD